MKNITKRLQRRGAWKAALLMFLICAWAQAGAQGGAKGGFGGAAAGLTPADAEATDGGDPLAQGRWTAAVSAKERGEVSAAVLRDVRAARQRGFDRVVFEFAGRDVPGYRIEYLNRPARQCGSGRAVKVAGAGRLLVRLRPAQAHDENGEATVRHRRRRLRLGALRELQSVCDFEGDVEWVLGVASRGSYRVTELTKPARLVIDIRH